VCVCVRVWPRACVCACANWRVCVPSTKWEYCSSFRFRFALHFRSAQFVPFRSVRRFDLDTTPRLFFFCFCRCRCDCDCDCLLRFQLCSARCRSRCWPRPRRRQRESRRAAELQPLESFGSLQAALTLILPISKIFFFNFCA